MSKTTRNNEGIGRYQWTPELVEENITRFHKYKSEGTLGNNGPKMPGNQTLFSPDRWKAMLENMAKTAPKAAKTFSAATNMKVGQSTKEASKVSESEEFVVEKNDPRWYDLETGEPTNPAYGSELPTKGMLMTEADTSGTKHPYTHAQDTKSAEKKDLNTNKIDAQTAINKDAIKKRTPVKQLQIQRDKEQAKRDFNAEIKFSSLADKFVEIASSYDSVGKLQEQQAKATEAAAKKREELDSKLMDDELAGITSQFVDLDEEYSNDRLEAALKGADEDRVSMEADADKRDNPYSTLTDKEKGDWEMKTLEPKDKSGTGAISMIISETGLDANKASALYGKLKGLCG